MSFPLISVITSTLNSEKTITDTINSVLGQTYFELEYIVIDGESKDRTVSILESFESEFKKKNISFNWISEPDSGIYDAFNKGLSLASGDWIVFLGSDDYLKNNTLFEEMIPFLNSANRDKINYVYGKIEHVNGSNEIIEIAGKPWSIQKERFSYTMNIGHSGCFHSKVLFEEHGNFNTSFEIAGDYEFLLRELKNKDAFFVDKILIVMREGGISGSLNNRLKLIQENRKARRLNKCNDFSKELFFWDIRVRVILFIKKLFGKSFATKIADKYRSLFLGKKKRWSV